MAVAQGLIFAIKWSQHQGYLAAAEERALAILNPARISDTEGVRSRILRDGQIEASQARVRGQETDTHTNLNFAFLEAHRRSVSKKGHTRILLTETQR